MKSIELNTSIVEGYAKLLDSLSPSSKLDLISKLTDSIKSDLSIKKTSFKKSFGSLVSDKDAEEIIAEIRNSRKVNRNIEGL